MSTGAPQYEFTEEQNRLLGSLAGRMSFVGLFCVVVGVSNILLALLVVGAIFRNQVPGGEILPGAAAGQSLSVGSRYQWGRRRLVLPGAWHLDALGRRIVSEDRRHQGQ
jgi:hypothetical protein